MPPTITKVDIMGMMIRVEAGWSSGAERNLLFQRYGELWNRGKAT